MQKSVDHLVIGGGCIGVSIAYHLAKRKVGSVLLLERGEFLGQESTGKCAGGIRAQFSTEINARLSLLSIDRFEHWQEEIATPFQYRQWGYLFLLTSDDLVARFKTSHAMWTKLGMKVEWLHPADISKRFPHVNMEGVRGATFHARDGFGDPNDITQGYASAARKHGAVIETGVEVTGIELSSTRRKVTGVKTSKGNVACKNLILATGAWSKVVAAWAGVDVPIEPLPRQIIVTDKFDLIKDPWPMTVDLSTTLYCHRESGGVLIGMSNEAQKPQFETVFDEDYGEKMLMTAMHRIPVLEHAAPKHKWSGLYETTPDHHPIFGTLPPVDGLYICAGFSGHGLMHAPAAGIVTSEIVLDGKAKSVDVSTLSNARFTGGGQLIDERNVI
ncbi:MAG: FAD-binding oxidoreductase [Planctomycetes bacterium]|nr:FAD-binding oxidoreductase [Planctomycetota bacterium]